MKKIKLLKTAVIVLVVINLVTLSIILYQNYRHDSKHHYRNKRHGSKMTEVLDLNSEQKKQFREMRKEHRREMEELRSDIRDLRYQQVNLVMSGYTPEAGDSLATLIAQNQKEIELSTMQHFANLKEMLSPEQVGKFNEFAGKFAERLKGKPEKDKR